MVSNLVGVAVSMATLSLVVGYGRRIVTKKAPFYGRSNISIEGIAFGLLVSVTAHSFFAGGQQG